MRARPLVRYHGGKYFISPFIISLITSHRTYIEPFSGMVNVLLQKPISEREIISDLDFSVYNLLSWCQKFPNALVYRLRDLIYSQETFDSWKNRVTDKEDFLEQAIKEYVVKRMSRGGLGKSFSWQNRLRGNQPGSINEWQTSIENIYKVSSRLKNVEIYNDNAISLIRKYDGQDFLFYLDPPYLPETRISKNCYNIEMTYDEHSILLETIRSSKSNIIISGYDSVLYNSFLKQWNKHIKPIVNHSGQSKVKQIREEVVWTNY